MYMMDFDLNAEHRGQRRKEEGMRGDGRRKAEGEEEEKWRSEKKVYQISPSTAFLCQLSLFLDPVEHRRTIEWVATTTRSDDATTDSRRNIFSARLTIQRLSHLGSPQRIERRLYSIIWEALEES